MSNIMNSNAINLNDVKAYVKANVMLQCQQLAAPRLAIQGPPGTGKSDIIREICQENGWTLTVKYLSNMSLEQITGIPCKVENGSTAIWSKPELFNFDDPECASDEYRNGDENVRNNIVKILLIDDFHLADRIMQRYLFQLLTYKSLNGYKLPPNTAILLAGNRNTDKALANPIPAPVCNRLMFIEVKSDLNDWLTNFAFKNNIRGDIISFLNNRRGEGMLSADPLESGAWASPRSWTYLSYQMDAYEKMFGKLSLQELKNMASGLIGPAQTSKFIEYRELFAKWDFNQLNKMPFDKVKQMFEPEVKNNPTDVYAITSAGASWMLSVYRDSNFNINDKNVIDAVKFVYDCFIYLLTFPNGTIRRNTRPIITAGTKYIHMFQEAVKNSSGKSVNSLLDVFIQNMAQDRDCDYLFYELLANVFDLELDDEELDRINEAKKRLKYDC